MKSNIPEITKIAVLISLDNFNTMVFTSYKSKNNIEIIRSIIL
jgi:hypothetical protein